MEYIIKEGVNLPHKAKIGETFQQIIETKEKAQTEDLNDVISKGVSSDVDKK